MIFCKSFIQDFKISETLILTQDPEPPYTHFEALPAKPSLGDSLEQRSRNLIKLNMNNLPSILEMKRIINISNCQTKH